MQNVREFRYPTTVGQALALLETMAPSAMVVAGGTSLSRWKDPSVSALLDITRLGLTYVREHGSMLGVGATLTLNQVARHPMLQSFCGGILCQAAGAVPSHLVRNASTLGGHAIVGSPRVEIHPVLIALDARVMIARDGAREEPVPAEEFVTDAQYRRLGRREIVTEFAIPLSMRDWRGAYRRWGRTCSDPAVAQAAVCLSIEGGRCTEARVALGGSFPKPIRSRAAEARLARTALTDADIERACRDALEGLTPVADFRFTPEYRMHLTGETLFDAIVAARDQTAGGGAIDTPGGRPR